MAVTSAVFASVPELGAEVIVTAGIKMDYPLHTHVSCRTFGLVRKGRIRLRRPSGTAVYRAGGCFSLPPHEPHRLTAAGPWELVSLCLTSPAAGIVRKASAARLLRRCVREGILAAAESDLLLRQVRAAPPAILSEAGADSPLERLRRRLEEDPAACFSLAAMAAYACVGERQLLRSFRRRYGLTPHRFQMQNRLRLLKRECAAVPLTAAALAAGFYDQSHAIREFRRLTGLTPGQYRAARRDFSPSSGGVSTERE